MQDFQGMYCASIRHIEYESDDYVKDMAKALIYGANPNECPRIQLWNIIRGYGAPETFLFFGGEADKLPLQIGPVQNHAVVSKAYEINAACDKEIMNDAFKVILSQNDKIPIVLSSSGHYQTLTISQITNLQKNFDKVPVLIKILMRFYDYTAIDLTSMYYLIIPDFIEEVSRVLFDNTEGRGNAYNYKLEKFLHDDKQNLDYTAGYWDETSGDFV